MKIAVIGGGINGVMTAWELLKRGHNVTLFEKHTVMSQTSSASSKLLHGGLRYLENFEFRLVKEALNERQWWIKQAPHLAHSLQFYIPVYKTNQRLAWMYKIGLWLYDFLAGKDNIGRHQNHSKTQMLQNCPDLKAEGLIKGFCYTDGQMDDYQLGLWALEQAKKLPGLVVFEHTSIERITVEAQLTLKNEQGQFTQTFDKIINIAGPWAEELLKENHISTEYQLDLVRGSHILINKQIQNGYFLEIPNERRIFFVLPYQGQTLIGTTEQRQDLTEDIKPSQQEIDYLINAYNYYFKRPITKQDITQSFAGLRPLVKSALDPSKATREYAIQSNQNLITVFGGKWTTARQLAIKIAAQVQ
ncbi:MAG: glycerol-3-phosphate dehydrogenase/oxidase [Bacteroidales bacterium]|jgi:glycerol-3-phosphate dehydrogenase|nr:glycerol-3-phosphate dehydrogenase/oxidase [Bacteroidales bacterium]